MPRTRAPAWQVWVALTVVYLVWGSTYLGMRVMVETIPPLLGSGIRFLAAGVVLYPFLVVRRGWAGVRVGIREAAASSLVGIRPEVLAIDPLTAALTMVEVRWAYLDEAGNAGQHTSYRYLLRRADSGRLGIQVVIDTTPQP